LNIDKYKVFATSNVNYYFFSEGPRGVIKKQILFEESRIKNYYQLHFGDSINGTIVEDVVSDNKDADLVLASVAWAVLCFVNRSDKLHVRFSGLTRHRTRLFNIWLGRNNEELSKYMLVFGYNEDGRWERFVPNRQYSAFMLKSGLTQ
jgi:hypothetical protein